MLAALTAVLCSCLPGTGAHESRQQAQRDAVTLPRNLHDLGPLGSFYKSAAIIAENKRPGTNAWRIPHPGPHYGIEGFADRTSAHEGQHVRLFVSTGARRFIVRAFRMGYYGGKGARLVWQSRSLRGSLQRGVSVSSSTNTVQALWRPSLRIKITRAWVPGDYLLKLSGTDGSQRYVPLTVTDPASRAAVVMMNGVTTWQAYNDWGGYSLYRGADGTYESRARAVSFDRPYSSGAGAAGFLINELPVVQLAERLGLDVTYITSVDLHSRPHLLTRHRALVSLGHDEYWSTKMRRAALIGRSRGTNIALLGANADYRHIRFSASRWGRHRIEICYKSAIEDPQYGRNNDAVTVEWRYPPLNKPESVLNGAIYECSNVSAHGRFVSTPRWLFHGSGIHPGTWMRNLVYGEYDRVQPGFPTPSTIQILAHSPLSCGPRATYADITYYSAPGGAGVFDASTSSWIPYIGSDCALGLGCDNRGRALATVTSNLLKEFAKGPAGAAHPSVPNTAHFGIRLSRPLWPALSRQGSRDRG
jgi:hypothetical protein